MQAAKQATKQTTGRKSERQPNRTLSASSGCIPRIQRSESLLHAQRTVTQGAAASARLATATSSPNGGNKHQQRLLRQLSSMRREFDKGILGRRISPNSRALLWWNRFVLSLVLINAFKVLLLRPEPQS